MLYEVLIVGGSYAGLSAAMSLGRARCRVLVIDAGLPRNRFTPHAHNLLLHDGDAPADLAAQACRQLAAYPTVQLLTAEATAAEKQPDGTFVVRTAQHGSFQGELLALATGLRDELPPVPGFAECWGKSIIHCPYCHGYEVADQPTGLWFNGDQVGEVAQLLLNWTRDLTVFTNGPATFGPAVRAQLATWRVPVDETPVAAVVQTEGQLQGLRLADGRLAAAPVLYARLPWQQASALHAQLGCALTANNLLQIDEQYQTTVPGVYALGDNCSMGHQLVQAMAAGNAVGAALSKVFIAKMRHWAA
ncbi:NAD(P)/FAD-dependent oxidoreductase [Hymenobacter sp. PAMC 26628]|uniref:NAD(P)/FAD-dependent oxidoreductase n=1 Tax=Hymenobacter sp. PAMC 26628 TaxID=1484118 RepID=UPI000770037B|nr:NAD(P)/FAD-dependent oxidoreductase [Hymenobacter sp. PAMC 26628]AMJ67378.1 hypothetical protein AXW84_19590 [Hymenobacter sp. PAMC 26628]